MSADAYHELADRAEKAIEAGTLNRFDFARFQRLYQAVIYDELEDADKADNLKKYPGLEQLGTIYVCESGYLTTVQRSLMEKTSTALEVNADFISAEEKKIGIENAAGTVQAYFEIPVIYQLHERDFIAKIDTPNIVHVKNSGYYLTKIYLLSNFFSTTAQDEGYLVIPDGSGAVIENNSRAETLLL